MSEPHSDATAPQSLTTQRVADAFCRAEIGAVTFPMPIIVIDGVGWVVTVVLPEGERVRRFVQRRAQLYDALHLDWHRVTARFPDTERRQVELWISHNAISAK